MKFKAPVGILVFLFILGCSHLKKEESLGPVTKSSGLGSAGLNLNVKKFELENGLRLLVYENHKLPIFSYYTFFDVGGRHERGGTTGATHFLEHMMFKGAKKYGPGQFDSTIEGSGGNNNAYTNFDNTVYYESVPSNIFEKIADLEADRMNSLLLLPYSFESERKVVFEERKMRYENSPRGQIYLKMMQTVFEGTPYGGSVIGSEEDLKNLKRDQVMDFFKKFYTPDNAIIVIAGDVDADNAYEVIKEKYGKLKRSSAEIKEFKAKADAPSLYSHRGKYDRWIKIHGESPTPMFNIAFPGVALATRDSYVLDILSSILGDGSSAYLNQKYVQGKKPLLSSIGVHNYNLKFNGVFYVYGQLLQRTNLKSLKRKIYKEFKNICDNSITERTVLKTKNQYLVGYYNAIQTNAGVASFLGKIEKAYGDYNYYKKELEIYDSITVDELKKTCHSIFSKKPVFLSVWKKHPKGKR